MWTANDGGGMGVADTEGHRKQWKGVEEKSRPLWCMIGPLCTSRFDVDAVQAGVPHTWSQDTVEWCGIHT
jgi:hypothetical protein